MGVTVVPVEVALTPAQQDVLDRLRAAGRPRPVVDPELRHEVRTRLQQALAPLTADVGPEPLFVNKGVLARVHACEAHHVAVAAEPFVWTIPAARGVVAHKAIELSVHVKGSPTPLELTDRAVERLADDAGDLAAFLRDLDDVARAELRAEVNDLVARFTELWPPLSKAWRPVTEARLRAELCDGRVQLAGKVDLTLGGARGTEAGKLVVDLKAGAPHATHLDDLRFYALLETMVVGVPPFRLATYYLASGDHRAEDVTEHVLEAAIRRTLDGVRKLVELRLGLRSPAVTPNPACGWCPARHGCDGARRWGGPDGDDLDLP